MGMAREGLMTDASDAAARAEPWIGSGSTWIRASISGILYHSRKAGERVHKGDVLGMISDPFGEQEIPVKAPIDGIIIGMVLLPLVYQGDALYHIAYSEEHPPDEFYFHDLLDYERDFL